jgi:enterochelin esterase-like enzyme
MTYGMTNDIKFGELRKFDIEPFQTVLIDELIPYIDTHFRTLANQENRAMAGLSMGGMETRQITLNRPDVFSHYGLFSGGVYSPEDLKEQHDGLKLVFISLRNEGYNAVSYISEGTAHEFHTWRRSLYQFAQLLFK